MKLISFLAGVATGVLLTRSMAAPAVTAAVAGRPAPTGDREDATLTRPRSDEELRERICSRFGRTIGNPDAIQVEVSGGAVTLRGQVQARDSILLMTEVENTLGVTAVQNLLDIQGSLEGVAPAFMHDAPAVRAAEQATSRMS
jgi:osmotically-inducible protein OsmY